ncbi:hypothetical protein D5086_000169 [Populus alba]|uniref:Uncharacterized protein n=1 Tax=Populus alba TaxID=43335 RepID=A0ACC4CVM4_POPAL
MPLLQQCSLSNEVDHCLEKSFKQLIEPPKHTLKTIESREINMRGELPRHAASWLMNGQRVPLARQAKCEKKRIMQMAEDISGFHANTHIPIIIGAQMRYEITGDPLYKDIGTFFMDIVTSSHSYATVSEFWSDPKRLASTLQTENEESCTTYNMLKIIPPFLCFCAHNLILFFVSDSKGIESFSKLGDSIYFEEEGEVPGLYIIQYISSSLDWKSGQIMINQKVDPVVSSDPYLRVTFTFSPNEVFATIDLSQKHTESLAIPAPGSFLSVNRKWSSGDKLSLQLPISLRTEAIQDDRHQYASIQAILYGPYLLAGHTSGAWNLAGSVDSLSDSITPIPASYNEQLVSFSQDSGNSTFVLTNSNQSITMEENPKSGTDALQQGKDSSLAVTNSAADDGSSIFRVVLGLDGKDGTVSLESGSQEGCYIYSGVNYKSGQSMKLSSKLGSSDPGFNQGASFVMNKGLSEYHPISFVAQGDKRNFLLAPLHSLRDEFYTIYFNFQA